MNSFGKILRITLYGTSHNTELGVIIDGCPAGISVSDEEFRNNILRRKTGGLGTSYRSEEDKFSVRSGLYKGKTDGTPLMISFSNNNTESSDYDFNGFFRPGHADFTAYKKYNGFNNPLGGGQFSGRMTLPVVAAGVIACKIINDITIEAKVLTAGGFEQFDKEIEKAKSDNDTLGGVIGCNVSNIPAGLGEPFFDSVESMISHAVFSIPGVKAIEFGNGIKGASMRGSEYNDLYTDTNGKTTTNNCGGINGGISNGNDINFKVYFRPASSIGKIQNTYNFITGKNEDFKLKGRHDTCYVLRTPVIIESITAIVLADLSLMAKVNR